MLHSGQTPHTKANHTTMTQQKIVIGGRRSQLAVVQSETVKRLIETKFCNQYYCNIVSQQTLGDQVQEKALYSFGGKALWTKELEDLLYSNDPELRLDMIVHSLKDMPTLLEDGFELGGITERVDPSDCCVMPLGSAYKSIKELPAGSIVGTSSVRRSAQLKRHFPHLKYKSIRGNINTRLAKLDDPNGEFACIILATAGLVRVNLQHRITERFDSDIMYHAVGQGALGIEIKLNDYKIRDILAEISHLPTFVSCLAERSLMRTLEGGCSVPIGVNSHYDTETQILHMKGIVISVEGDEFVEDEITYKINDIRIDSINCGKKLADMMIENGAKKILDKINLNKIDQ